MPAARRPSTRPPLAGLEEMHRRKALLAELCKAYPETVALNRYDNEHLSLEVSGKRFGYYLYQHFGDDGRSGAVLRAERGVQETLVDADPDRFWVPAFVGRHGWIGIRMDLEEPDWDTLAGFVRDAWLMTAPRKLRLAYQQSR